MANIAGFVDHGSREPTCTGCAGLTVDLGAGVLKLRLIEDFDAARTAWGGFEERAVAMPFQSHAWLSAWVKANRNNSALHPLVVFGYEDGRLAIILPLAVERVFGIRRLVWLGQQFSDYNAPLVDPSLLGKLTAKDASMLIAKAGKLAGGVDYAFLAKQPEMLGGRPNPFISAGSYEFTCAAHHVRLAESWEVFSEARASGKSRRRLREKEKRLANRHGTVEYMLVEDRKERARLIEQLVGWKVAQLKARGDRVPFDDIVAREFFRHLGAGDDGAGRVRLYALKCGGRPVAMALCLAGGKRLVYYLCGYDAGDTSRMSPGLLLLTNMLRIAHEDGFALFDFSNGDEEYKDRWADGEERIMVSGRAFTPLGMAGLACERARLELIRAIKSDDRVLGLARRAIRLRRGAA